MAEATKDEGVTFLGHPISLYVLFFSEFWERFSFYGMRALLTLYMIDKVAGLEYTDAEAYSVYAAYGTLVYATPAVGGMLADRVLGYRKAIIFGAVLMALGHFAMAVEHPVFFYGALSLLILGNGFFKPNISSLVGKLYRDGDPRRDGAFTIFYMGINAGAAIAPLVCGWLTTAFAHTNAEGELVKAWHYGFGLAGVGMVLGLITFLAFQSHLGDKGLEPENPPETPLGPLQIATYIVPFLLVGPIMWLITQHEVLGGLLLVIGGLVFGGIFLDSLRRDKVERERLWVVLVLMFFSMLFWAFFEQAGSSISVFTERNVNRAVMGTTIDAAQFQSVNPLFILIFAPIFAALWTRLGRVGRDPSTPVKFGLGMVQLGLGFAMLWFGASTAVDGVTAMHWLLLAYLFHTTGELCLSPVGLSMVTKLSPPQIVGTVMGGWFLATAFSHYLGGMIAALTGSDAGFEEGYIPQPHETIELYTPIFGSLAAVAVVAGLFVFVISPILSRWMHTHLMGEDAGDASPGH